MNNPIVEQRWAIAMAETVCVAGCTCIFCTRRSVCIRSLARITAHISSQDADARADHTCTTPRSHPRRHVRRSLPSTGSVMEVLYPSSYLGTPPAFPDPPSYLPGDTQPSTAQENYRERTERTPLISSTVATVGGTLAPSGYHDPLVEEPSLTGVPSPGAHCGRVPPAEPNAPVVGLGIGVFEEVEPPPAYSRFDESRSRLPVASDLLGPYPHFSVFNHLRDEGWSGSLEAAKNNRSPT